MRIPRRVITSGGLLRRVRQSSTYLLTATCMKPPRELMLLMRMVVPVFGVITFARGDDGSQKSVASLNTDTAARLGITDGAPLTWSVIPSVGLKVNVES